eukprot:Clim_evm9s99 gene=Clim_evmTU9s99
MLKPPPGIGPMSCSDSPERSYYGVEYYLLYQTNELDKHRYEGVNDEDVPETYLSPDPRLAMELPDEALAHIFSFVSTARELCEVERVCKRWHRVIHESEVWYKMTVFHFDRKIWTRQKLAASPMGQTPSEIDSFAIAYSIVDAPPDEDSTWAVLYSKADLANTKESRLWKHRYQRLFTAKLNRRRGRMLQETSKCHNYPDFVRCLVTHGPFVFSCASSFQMNCCSVAMSGFDIPLDHYKSRTLTVPTLQTQPIWVLDVAAYHSNASSAAFVPSTSRGLPEWPGLGRWEPSLSDDGRPHVHDSLNRFSVVAGSGDGSLYSMTLDSTNWHVTQKNGVSSAENGAELSPFPVVRRHHIPDATPNSVCGVVACGTDGLVATLDNSGTLKLWPCDTMAQVSDGITLSTGGLVQTRGLLDVDGDYLVVGLKRSQGGYLCVYSISAIKKAILRAVERCYRESNVSKKEQRSLWDYHLNELKSLASNCLRSEERIFDCTFSALTVIAPYAIVCEDIFDRIEDGMGASAKMYDCEHLRTVRVFSPRLMSPVIPTAMAVECRVGPRTLVDEDHLEQEITNLWKEDDDKNQGAYVDRTTFSKLRDGRTRPLLSSYTILVAGQQGRAKLIDPCTEQILVDFLNPFAITAVQLDLDVVIMAHVDASIHVYDRLQGNPLLKIPFHHGRVWTLRSDALRIFSGSLDGKVRGFSFDIQGRRTEIRRIHPDFVSEEDVVLAEEDELRSMTGEDNPPMEETDWDENRN